MSSSVLLVWYLQHTENLNTQGSMFFDVPSHSIIYCCEFVRVYCTTVVFNQGSARSCTNFILLIILSAVFSYDN